MFKMTPRKPRQENRDLGIIAVLIIVIALLVLIIILMSFNLTKFKDEAEEEKTFDWLIDNCKCTDWEGEFSCFEGFEIKGNFCWRDKQFTLPLRGCSKFVCPEYIMELNNNTLSWERIK